MSPVPTWLRTARARAAAGAWTEVIHVLGDSCAEPADAAVPELVTLRAEALLRTGRAADARAWLARLLPLVRQQADRRAARAAVNLLGAAHFHLGELADAEAAFSTALELAQADGDDLLVARAMNNLGAIANIRGERHAALGCYQLAIPAYQRIGQLQGLAESHHNTAITFRDLGQLTLAEEHERRALEYALEGGLPRLTAMARVGLAEISLRRGDPLLAAAGARRAAAAFAAVGDPTNEADAWRLVASACTAARQLEQAGHALDRAGALAEAHGPAIVMAEIWQARAELALHHGDRVGAARAATASAAEFERLGAAAQRDSLVRWAAALAEGRDAELPAD